MFCCKCVWLCLIAACIITTNFQLSEITKILCLGKYLNSHELQTIIEHRLPEYLSILVYQRQHIASILPVI